MVSEKQINLFAEAAAEQAVGTKCYLYEDGTYSFRDRNRDKATQFIIVKRIGQTSQSISYNLMNWGDNGCLDHI